MKRLFLCLGLSLAVLPCVALADQGTITALDLANHSIEITNKGAKTTYALTSDTVVQIAGKSAATVNDLTVGMTVQTVKYGTGIEDPINIEEIDIAK
jgi:hypothetical protein